MGMSLYCHYYIHIAASIHAHSYCTSLPMWFLFCIHEGRNPKFNIDLSGSHFSPNSYSYENGQYVFNVEQGTQFYLRYNANTSPPPSASDVELYRNGQHLRRSPTGTITLEGSYMNIPTVNQGADGVYTIKSSSGGELSFRLKVKGN